MQILLASVYTKHIWCASNCFAEIYLIIIWAGSCRHLWRIYRLWPLCEYLVLARWYFSTYFFILCQLIWLFPCWQAFTEQQTVWDPWRITRPSTKRFVHLLTMFQINFAWYIILEIVLDLSCRAFRMCLGFNAIFLVFQLPSFSR